MAFLPSPVRCFDLFVTKTKSAFACAAACLVVLVGVSGGPMSDASIAGAPAFADPLPERKPGHWRITSISAELGMTEIDACILAGDSIAVPSEGSVCSVPDVQRVEDQVIVNVTCRTKLGEERISTLFTGDFQTWYRGITKMTFDPPTQGQTGMAVTVDAKYVGQQCPPS